MGRPGRDERKSAEGVRALVRLLVNILTVMLLVFAGRMAYVYGFSVFAELRAEPAPGRDVEVVIPPEASLAETARILKKAGVVESVGIFMAEEKLSAYHGQIRPGTYLLNTSLAPTEILAVLSGSAGYTAEEGYTENDGS